MLLNIFLGLGFCLLVWMGVVWLVYLLVIDISQRVEKKKKSEIVYPLTKEKKSWSR